MEPGEYERQRRAIQKQLDADLELVRAGAAARLRALESLWLSSRAEERQDVRNDTPASVETAASRDAAGAPRRGDILNAILDTFPSLPDVFDKSDVVRLLGYEPSRPTFHRAWARLLEENLIAVACYSDGRRPTSFRKLTAE